jgi:hypothetical protein
MRGRRSQEMAARHARKQRSSTHAEFVATAMQTRCFRSGHTSIIPQLYPDKIMRNVIVHTLVIGCILLLRLEAAHAQDNIVGFDILGRGALYSVNFE